MTGMLTSWNPIGVHRHAAPFKRAKDRDKKRVCREREKIVSHIKSLVTSEEDRFTMVNFVDLF